MSPKALGQCAQIIKLLPQSYSPRTLDAVVSVQKHSHMLWASLKSTVNSGFV